MSFTITVKQELNRVSRDRPCCRTAELAALVRGAGSFHLLGNRQYGLDVSFGLSATARTLVSLVKSFDLPTEVRVRQEKRMRPHKRFEIYMEGGARLVQFLNEIGVLSDSMSLQERLPGRIISRPCCQASFLRGAFVAAGSVSEPGSPTHLEIYSENGAFLRTVQLTAEGLGMTLKITERRRHPAAYAKNLKTVEDFLVATGAHQAAIEFAERSVMSRVREDANRLANCDQANAVRCSAAAARQIQAINALKDSGRFDRLPPALQEMADLRVRHPSATLLELSRRAEPPLSKSAVNHRLRRLTTLAGSSI